jgi:mannose-6-phosphate isomerase-like protein (cupin superfamily)
VAPERRLSLQRHFKRIERWTIVAGMGVVTLGARTRSPATMSIRAARVRKR